MTVSDSPLVAALSACLSAGEEALERCGIFEQRLEFAGLTVQVRFAGEALYQQMTRAFAHILSNSDAQPDLDVVVWDSIDSGIPLPSEVGPLQHHVRRGLGQIQQSGNVLSLFEGMDHGLSMLDLEARRAVYWVPDADHLAEGDRAAPLRTILNWWLPSEGRTVLHAGALATGDGAVLLFGKSGAGKSTTSLACVEDGFDYLSDDFCALTLEPEVVVHSLYCSGKVYEHHIQELPAFGALVTNPDSLDTEKAIGFLGDGVGSVKLNAPVRAVVMITAKGMMQPVIQPVSRAIALRGVAPSTMLNLPGPAGSQLASMAKLVNRVPCFAMQLASDVSANPPALRQLLADISTGKAG